MSIKTKIVAALLVLALPVIALTSVASAQTFRADDASTVGQSETIDGAAFVAGSTVDVAGTIKGDLYCAGQTITISGTVEGDVLCAGQNIRLSGSVAGDIRLAGQIVSVDGTVGESATLAGQTISIDGKAKVGQDAILTGQSVVVNGTVGRDAVVAGESVTVGSSVARNVNADANSVKLTAGATIGGKLNYTSPQKVSMESGATVSGEVVRSERQYDNGMNNRTFDPVGVFVWPLMMLVSALVLVLLFPRVFRSVTDPCVASFPHALLAILVGLIAGIAVPILIFIAFVTVLGIPLAIIMLVAWILVALLSGMFAAFYVGRLIWRRGNAIVAIIVGSLVLSILMMIPFLNFIVFLVAFWYGSGALLLTIKRRWPLPRYSIDPRSFKPLRSRKARS